MSLFPASRKLAFRIAPRERRCAWLVRSSWFASNVPRPPTAQTISPGNPSFCSPPRTRFGSDVVTSLLPSTTQMPYQLPSLPQENQHRVRKVRSGSASGSVLAVLVSALEQNPPSDWNSIEDLRSTPTFAELRQPKLLAKTGFSLTSRCRPLDCQSLTQKAVSINAGGYFLPCTRGGRR
jgi:hypothetical protein